MRLSPSIRCLWLCAVVACRFDPSGIASGGASDAAGSDGAGSDSASCQDCPVLVPSNGAGPEHLQGVSSGLLVGGGEQGYVDTDTGEIQVAGVTVRSAGVDRVSEGLGFHHLGDTIAVLGVDTLTIESNGALRIRGSRALIVLSQGDAAIHGLLDVSAGCDGGEVYCAGPGGGDGAHDQMAAQGCAPGGKGVEGSGDETGGGGGGLGGKGGAGGNGSGGASGGAASELTACPDQTLEPLQGGSGGGQGGPANDEPRTGGVGGGGGGAVQISSYTRIALQGGEIYAAGAGGDAPASDGNVDGGGGGGAGGAILLEAPAIQAMSAIITANGGGGGGGGNRDNNPQPGAYGRHDAEPAAGGVGADSMSDGGPGGARGVAAQPGQSGDDGTGGGGGGTGIIRFNVPAAMLDIAGATISPAESRGDARFE